MAVTDETAPDGGADDDRTAAETTDGKTEGTDEATATDGTAESEGRTTDAKDRKATAKGRTTERKVGTTEAATPAGPATGKGRTTERKVGTTEAATPAGPATSAAAKVADAPDAAAGGAPGDGAPPRGGVLGMVRRMVPSALEILALTAFVFARPVFGSLGRSPETFIARGADWTDVIALALIILLVPAVVAVLAEILVGLVLGERVRRACHVAGIAVLFGLVVWEVGGSLVDWGRVVGLVVAVGLGLALTVLLVRSASMATFLRYASVGALVFLVQFLAMSPVASIVLGGRHAGDAVDVGLGDDAPPVVLVVLDGMPTSLLLDGHGRIDAELYPNLASLAGDATWYRNHTTVAQITLEAVPAILSGSTPEPGSAPVASNYEHNLFSLLRESHDIHGAEQVTGLCPVEDCPEEAGSPIPGLLHDAGFVFEKQITDAGIDFDIVPHVFWNRMARAREWVQEQDFTREGRPDLHVVHLLTPHPAWEFLPDGSGYAASAERPSGLFVDVWSPWAVDVARQRHVLQMQATDALLGDLLDRIRADGAYDDSLIAVTADHGYAFADDAPWRALDEDNLQEILWTPLIIKAPGQTESVVDDANVNSLDILPTIAAELGVEDLPWEPDGRPAGTVDRDPADKWVVDWSWARLHPDDGSDIVEIDGEEPFERVLASDPVEGTGPLGVWQRTEYGPLLGRSVSELEVGAPDADVTAEVPGLATWDDVNIDRPPLEFLAHAPVPAGTTVAITVDGRIAATVPAHEGAYGFAMVHALLWPDTLSSGRNEIGMYRVDGPPSAPVLHELNVVPKP